MTIFFAPARRTVRTIPEGFLCGSLPLRAANDNRAGQRDGDRLLRLALRHFAEHGLSAAERAAGSARQAHHAGSHADCLFWLAICKTLDRRLALRTSAELGVTAE